MRRKRVTKRACDVRTSREESVELEVTAAQHRYLIGEVGQDTGTLLSLRVAGSSRRKRQFPIRRAILILDVVARFQTELRVCSTRTCTRIPLFTRVCVCL